MNYNLIAVLILGAIVGFFIGTYLVNRKKAKEKKNSLKEIQKQKQQEFLIPIRKEGGKLEQKRINLKKYVGLIENEKKE